MEKNLFTSYEVKNLSLKNRIVMPPMCQYSAIDGIANEWHYLHYTTRAIGGVGLIIVEMTNVDPDGRITDGCLGLWNTAQRDALKRIVESVHAQGSKIAIQIAHAGRKAEDTDHPVSASDVPFSKDSKTPRALTTEEVYDIIQKFKQSVKYAVEAGFDSIQIHGAHGYLIHQFHSPLTNLRTDEFGQEKTKFGVDIIKAAKSVMPEDMPLMMRISAHEYIEGGYSINDAIELSRIYKEAGVDMFDVSSGGEGPIGSGGQLGTHAGYQVPFARKIKEALDVPVIAVGKLSDVALANAVVGNEDAELVAIGRGVLRNPYWALEANKVLNKLDKEKVVPKQYIRGF